VFYIPEVTGFKEKPLNISLMSWDLGDFSTAMKISIAEEDPSGQEQETTESTVEFAGNAGVDLGWGNDFKVGLKFGASAKQISSVKFTRTIQIGDDELGEAWVNFGDMIILSESKIPIYDPTPPIVIPPIIIRPIFSTQSLIRPPVLLLVILQSIIYGNMTVVYMQLQLFLCHTF
jgi:hypothetical protein